MQNVYVITARKYNGDLIEFRVLAPNVAKAVNNAERYIKKNYFSSTEIRAVEFSCKVEAIYKS